MRGRGKRKERKKLDWEPVWTGDTKEASEGVLNLRKPFRVNGKSDPQP